MDDAVGPLILKNADAQTIKRAAMLTGHGHPARRRRAQGAPGLTRVEEVLAATQEDVDRSTE